MVVNAGKNISAYAESVNAFLTLLIFVIPSKKVPKEASNFVSRYFLQSPQLLSLTFTRLSGPCLFCSAYCRVARTLRLTKVVLRMHILALVHA